MEIIIPVHGHYDHALDSGVLALWSGSRLISDDSIEAVLEASTHLPSAMFGLEDWREPAILRPFKSELSQRSETISLGNFEITLIRTPHLNSLPTFFIRGKTEPNLRFPAGIGEFRLGTSFSVYVEHGERSLLIVPSAGDIGETFSGQPSVQADTIFLGVGGLGIRRRGAIEAFWNDTVAAVGANSVFLIHWDSDQVAFDFDQPDFRIARPVILRRTWQVFNEMRSRDTLLSLPPAITPFHIQ